MSLTTKGCMIDGTADEHNSLLHSTIDQTEFYQEMCCNLGFADSLFDNVRNIGCRFWNFLGVQRPKLTRHGLIGCDCHCRNFCTMQ